MLSEWQRLRVRLTLKKITMNIKFPCSLAIQVKSDTHLHDLTSSYHILNGECPINETLNLDIELTDPPNRNPPDKKLTVSISMISQSGRVSAGHVVVNVSVRERGEPVDTVQFLEKCPDKGAKIYYSYSTEISKGRTEKLDKTIISDLRLTERRQNEQAEGQKIAKAYSSVQIPYTTRNSYEERFFKQKRSPEKSNSKLTESKVEKVISVGNHKERLETNFSVQTYQFPSKSRDKSKERITHAPLSYTPLTNPLTQRISEQFEDEDELAKLREKLRAAQKSDRSTIQHIKELKEESQKRRGRVSYLEGVKAQLQEALREREDRLKKCDKANKQLSEQVSEQSNQVRSLKNQLEMRESMLKEQSKKLEEKYRFSQCEREKITEEYNRVLKTYQESEKKYQNILKDKERSIHEERQRNSKKIEQLNNTILLQQSHIQKLTEQTQQLTQHRQHLSNTHSQIEQNNLHLQQQLQQKLTVIKQLQQSIRQLEGQVFRSKEVQGERVQLKKKHNELTLLNTQLQQRAVRQEKTIHSLEERLKELQEQSIKRSSEKNQINQRLLSLKKNCEALKSSEQQSQKEKQSLILTISNANNKINELKSKLQQQRKNMEDLQKEFENKYTSLLTDKQQLQNQAEELRWELQKNHAIVQQLNSQLTHYNQKNYELSEQLIERSQKIKKLQEHNKLMNITNEHLAATVSELQGKKKENLSTYKEANSALNQYRRKSDKLEKDNMDLREKIKALGMGSKERYQDYDKRIKERDQLCHSLQVKVNSLEAQLRELVNECSSQQQQASTLNQEISHLKDMLISSKREAENQQSLLLRLKESQAQTKRLLCETREELAKKSKEHQDLSKKMGKDKEEAQNYQSALIASFEDYLVECLKVDEQIRWTPSSLSASLTRIGQLQLQAIQKHNSLISKNKMRVGQLNLEKENLQYCLSKARVELQQVKHQYQSSLSKQRQKAKQAQSLHTLLQQEYKELQSKHQQLTLCSTKEQEHFRIQMLKINEDKQQLQSQLNVVLVQYQNAKEQNKQLQAQLQQMKNYEQQQKATLQTKYMSIHEDRDSQIEQHQALISHLQKKILSYEKQIKEKGQSIRKHEQHIHSISYDNEKKQARITELTQALNEHQQNHKQLLAQLKEKEKQLKKWSDSYDQLAHSYQTHKEERDQLLYKTQEQNNLILDLSKEVERYKDETEAVTQKIEELQVAYKGKVDSLKSVLDKQSIQLKELNEKMIVSSSQAELKKFMNKQLESSIALEREQKEDLRSELQRKKSQILSLTETNHTLTSHNKQLQSQIEEVESEKEVFLSSIEKYKTIITSLRKNSQEVTTLSDKIAHLQRQIQKLTQQKSQCESYYERQLSQLKSSLRDAKRVQGLKVVREEQVRKKVRVLQKLLESDNMELTASRKKMLQEIERDKRQYLSKNELLEARVRDLENQLDSSRLRHKRETQKLTKEMQALREESESKDFFIKNQQYELDNTEYRLTEAISQKNSAQKQAEKEQAKAKTVISQLSQQNQALKQKIHQVQQQQSKTIIEAILKKLSKVKSKKVQSTTGPMDKLILNNYYGDFEDILAESAEEIKRNGHSK